MNLIRKLYLGIFLLIINMKGVFASIGGEDVPEMDASLAFIALGLVTALAALVSEHRR